MLNVSSRWLKPAITVAILLGTSALIADIQIGRYTTARTEPISDQLAFLGIEINLEEFKHTGTIGNAIATGMEKADYQLSQDANAKPERRAFLARRVPTTFPRSVKLTLREFIDRLSGSDWHLVIDPHDRIYSFYRCVGETQP